MSTKCYTCVQLKTVLQRKSTISKRKIVAKEKEREITFSAMKPNGKEIHASHMYFYVLALPNHAMPCLNVFYVSI